MTFRKILMTIWMVATFAWVVLRTGSPYDLIIPIMLWLVAAFIFWSILIGEDY